MAYALFSILIFPGILFLGIAGLIGEFLDRKLHARLQNRIGPPWYQPLADFIKLLGKESIVPAEGEKFIFRVLPIIALASIATAFLYVPLWGAGSLFPFNGDIIVVIYLLTIPTITFFLAGWSAKSAYSMIGAVRSLTQLFAYEVPLYMAVLSPALLANSWSFKEITAFYNQHPAYACFNLLGFMVAGIALQGKLERVPFDIPEAETEIVAGPFTEFSGRYLALFRLAIDMEMIVGASLLAAIFMPFGMQLNSFAGFAVYLTKIIGIIALLTVFRTIFARLRIDQMIDFCWKYLAPLALFQLILNLVLKGVL